uniref:Cwf21 domain-containing protein n=1 Tax=Caenorhabditis tropicalis TaxID=1561998 RepID=A0A1I7TVS1_9PELO
MSKTEKRQFEEEEEEELKLTSDEPSIKRNREESISDDDCFLEEDIVEEEEEVIEEEEEVPDQRRKVLQALDKCEKLGGDDFEAEQQRVLNELSKQRDTIKALLDDLKTSKDERLAAESPKKTRSSNKK